VAGEVQYKASPPPPPPPPRGGGGGGWGVGEAGGGGVRLLCLPFPPSVEWERVAWLG